MKLFLRFLRWFCHPDLIEDVEGDLMELFQERLVISGKQKANWFFAWDVVKLFRPSIIRNLEGQTQINNYGMFKNYFKTALRSMARNRLFTAINVLGLAVSMSIGLLIISFISDLLSYDSFHKNNERIHRVITTNQDQNGFVMNLASTSVKAGYNIKESITGIDQLTLVRQGFGGDAAVGESRHPLQGFWADNSFLKVFTFPLLEGNPATALKEPYSLVLTEKAANRLFGNQNALGQLVKFDTLSYKVTGVMQDIPKLAHLKFEALISFSTVELQKPHTDGGFLSWSNVFMNYVYLVLPPERDLQALQVSLNQMCEVENAAIENQKIMLSLQPLNEISIGSFLANEIGPTMDSTAVWVLVVLTFIVILSACFNYTNLSIARSMKRSREVGIRKVIGALRRQVIGQFITESVLISLLALVFSFLLFLFLREQFIGLHPIVADLVSLELSPRLILIFAALAVIIGVMAGVFPALFFSKIKALSVLKGSASLQLFKRVNVRKSLIVIQYVFSLIFITTTVIGYSQYKGFLTFDLGFDTENIVNIKLQGNKAELLAQKLSELPEVSSISQSRIITSLGSLNGTQLKYKDPNDSSTVFQNFVDEHYLPLHNHVFLAGQNFKQSHLQENQVIVNEQLLNRFNIGGGDPNKAIGEALFMDGNTAIIVGVLKDFHYQVVSESIQPFIVRYSASPGVYINAKIVTNDWPSTFARIESAWKELDGVHPLDARFYDDQIEHAYGQFSMMIKVIGFLSFLTIFISSMGLFGMVVFTTETKLKEISIRKVLGASEKNIMVLLTKNFLILLVLSGLIALPVTYFFFDKVVLVNFAYHQPIGLGELLVGFLGVLFIAVIMIGTQTFKASRAEPALMLRDE